eukprot:CAMPEP_0117430232 /NCGR_PEP_ID=MMETSP0758-20121206/9759_1 /TAXON_ID=63605 /ORGANISM="Percolomonas cosmopolitus, Strain AE-1 (ATCC 50343)" /LENGTH=521 /DNA_ID=CAMNT_0005218021 /DNA_START=143 /DNA_END=1705 /DNA_ORIENTATION=+
MKMVDGEEDTMDEIEIWFDSRGMPVVNGSQLIVDTMNQVINNILTYTDSTKKELKILRRAKKCAAAQLLLAVSAYNMGEDGLSNEALRSASLIEHKSLRDEKLLKALQLIYLEGKTLESIKIHHEISKLCPSDILNIYICFNSYIYFYDMEGGKSLVESTIKRTLVYAQDEELINEFKKLNISETRDMLSAAEKYMVSSAPSKPLKEKNERFSYFAGEDSYILGILCFIEDQLGHIERAKQLGEKSYSLNKKAPWTHHSLSHIYQDKGNIDYAIEFMVSHAPDWSACIPFMRSHNWWHIGLLYLNKYYSIKSTKQKKIIGDKLIDIFKKYLWCCNPPNGKHTKEALFNSDPSVAAGAIGMLWHLNNHQFEMDKLNRWYKKRWSEVFDIIYPLYTNAHFFPFSDLHFAYAMILHHDNDKEVDQYVKDCQTYCKEYEVIDNNEAITTVLPAVIDGFYAYRKGQVQKAFQVMHPKATKFHLLGGSHAQRLALDETYLLICNQSGHEAEQKAYLDFKTPKDGVMQ